MRLIYELFYELPVALVHSVTPDSYDWSQNNSFTAYAEDEESHLAPEELNPC